MIPALIAITGILAGLLIAVIWIDIPTWLVRPGRAAAALREAQSEADRPLTGVQRWVAPLDKPVARWTPAGMMRSLEADMYWAHIVGQYTNWTAGQFMSLQVGGTLAMLVLGTLLMQDLLLGPVFAAAVWFVLPMNLRAAADRARKTVRSQLPEFVQLIAASMAAGVSLEEALIRSARVNNLVGRWVKTQVEASAGRMMIQQLQREAQASRLSELITFAVQLSFVTSGTNQQALMRMLSDMMAQEYIAKANERAQSVSTDLTLQAGLFHFIPFMALLLILLAGPMVSSLF